MSSDLIPTHALRFTPVQAWCIIHAGKDFDNRAPKSPTRRIVVAHSPLKIFVHAGHQTQKDYVAAAAFIEQAINPGRIDAGFAPVVLPSMAELRQGGIIGAVTVLRWLDSYTSPWAISSGLLLADPEPRPFIPCQGHPGIFLPNL